MPILKRFLLPVLAIFFSLVACTATFNWREVRFDEQNFVALFPTKHHFEQQTIRIHQLTKSNNKLHPDLER